MESKIDSRTKILTTASRLFQLQGYHATGMNQIIRESGSPKGSLYYYFPNGKEELAIESIKLAKELTKIKIIDGLSKFSDAIEAIPNFIRSIGLEINQQELIIPCSVSLLALETSLISEPLREACQQAFEAWGNIYTEKLIQSGFTKERAVELGIVIQLMIEGALIISITKKDMKQLSSVAEQITILLKNLS